MTTNISSTGNDNFNFHESDLNLSQHSLDGEIYNPEIDKNASTLDEPIRETIIRDLKAIGIKFWHVLYPKNNKMLIKEWDLWGPLLLCTILSIVLECNSHSVKNPNGGGPEFGQVFILFWMGSAVVTLNAQLLGADVSFLQTVCVLGYCVLPLTIATIVCAAIGYGTQFTIHLIAKIVIAMAGFAWSTFSSTAFLTHCSIPKRKALAIYPIMLFYFFLAWMAICQKNE